MNTALAARDLSVVACPVVALLVIRMWLGAGGPATASASATHAAEPVATVAGHRGFSVLESEVSYMRHAEELAGTEAPDIFPRVQLPEPTEEFPVEEPIETTPEPVDVVQPAPDLVVTSIMAGRVPIAIIDGRAHRVGDKVGPGWSITEIATGRVTIVHLDGRTKVITIGRAGP